LGIFSSIGIDRSNIPVYIADILWHLALPALSLGLILMAYYVKLTRTSFIEVLSSNYITASRSWGLRGRTIIFRHAFRNAILPIVTLAGIQIGLLIGGVVIVETIFSWPGIGMLTIEAIQSRDYPLLLGIFTFTAISMVAANIVIDVAYTKIDPRIRLR
jgi:peptide/nickel transport system permease protein